MTVILFQTLKDSIVEPTADGSLVENQTEEMHRGFLGAARRVERDSLLDR